MKTAVECERARLEVMAALDGEGGSLPESGSSHVATCEWCQDWLKAMEATNVRLRTLTYPAARVDLWSPVEQRISRGSGLSPAIGRLWPVGAAMLAWRALQLFVELPWPLLHPVVPIAAAGLVAWRLGGNFLAIELTAPELQKRGI